MNHNQSKKCEECGNRLCRACGYCHEQKCIKFMSFIDPMCTVQVVSIPSKETPKGWEDFKKKFYYGDFGWYKHSNGTREPIINLENIESVEHLIRSVEQAAEERGREKQKEEDAALLELTAKIPHEADELTSVEILNMAAKSIRGERITSL